VKMRDRRRAIRGTVSAWRPDAGCRIQDTGCRMQDSGYRMQDAGFQRLLVPYPFNPARKARDFQAG